MAAPNIVIDTNVIVAGLRSRNGASSRLLSLIGTKRFVLHLSVPLVLEYEAVLYGFIETTSISAQVADDLIDALCALGVHHDIHYLWRPYLSDPDDEMILELAIASQSDYVLTYNKRDMKNIEQLGIAVITPKEFLEVIGEI